MKQSPARYTPGPWRYFKQHNGKPEYTTTFHLDSKTRGHMAVITVYDLNSSPKWRLANQDAVKEYEETMAEVEANARLIAAAPELLTIAKAYRNLLKNSATTEAELATFQMIESTLARVEA